MSPLGTIFINSLKLIAVPLILASLVKGVSDLKNIAQLSSMGGRTIGMYLLTTLTAVTIGLTIVNIIQPGNNFFLHMILMDSENELAMNLGETYLVTENSNERLGKQKLDLVII